MSDFLSKLASFFLSLRWSWILVANRRKVILRWIVVCGTLAVGLLLLYFWYRDIWEHAERIRNLALVAAAVFGLPIAAWRSYTAHLQAKTAQNSLLDERYQRAAEMLGGKIAVQMAGIHALVRMAQSDLTHHVRIMSTLSAVVRTRAKRQDAPGREQKREGVSGREQKRESVAVIMEALGARTPDQIQMEEWEGDYKLDLRETDLRGLMRAPEAIDEDKPDLQATDLRERPVSKVMFPRAILDDAVISDSKDRAVFLNTDFQDASLIGASLDAAVLSGVNLASANLTNADFSNAEFKEVNIENAILDNTNLTNVTGLTQQQLNSAKIDPSCAPVLDGATDPDTGQPLVVPS